MLHHTIKIKVLALWEECVVEWIGLREREREAVAEMVVGGSATVKAEVPDFGPCPANTPSVKSCARITVGVLASA